jgi:hypothetical protein
LGVEKMGKKFSEMTDAELISMYRGLWQSVNIIECFGTSDLFNMKRALRELENRGYESKETKTVEIVKKEADEDECDDSEKVAEKVKCTE